MNILVINMIAGRLDRLEALAEQVRDAHVGAVFVLGNVVEPQAQPSASARSTSAEQSYGAALGLLGTLGAPIYLIPGEHDPSLAAINRAVQEYSGPARVALVHRTAAVCGTSNVVAGFGGRLTHEQEQADESIHFPAWEARVAFEHLHAYNDLFRTAERRILLFAMSPQASHPEQQTAGHGVGLLSSLIRAYQPVLVCCGGPTSAHSVETLGGTRVVNPGWLSEGSYALIDLDRTMVRFGRLPEPIALDDTFRSIVVALDGSPQAWRALELAASLAKRTSARLTLVYAWEPIEAFRGQPYLDDAIAQRTAAGERILETASRCIPDLPVEHELLEGPAAVAIMEAAEAHHADLIVMGARGMGALRSALGSVSQRVLHDAHCAVLIAREPPRHLTFLR